MEDTQKRNLSKDIPRKARMETQIQKISFSLLPISFTGLLSETKISKAFYFTEVVFFFSLKTQKM